MYLINLINKNLLGIVALILCVSFHSFCANRWLEDESVAKRALDLWPNIVKIVGHWEKLCKSSQPNNKSYETLTKYYQDKAFPLKLQYFKDIAGHLEDFLTIMQVDVPMMPFLEETLIDLITPFMKMVLKSDVLDEANTSLKLIKIDLTKAENLLPCELIKLPTATKDLLKTSLLKNDKKQLFKNDYKAMIIAMLQKIQDKCPLKYAVAHFASSISPSEMVGHKEKCDDSFCRLVDKLYAGCWISSKTADLAKKEFAVLLKATNSEHKDAFLTFNQKKDAIDSLFADLMSENVKYKNCWNVFMMIFTLSHGQASVERGSSVNKKLLVENLMEESIESQRMVYDHIRSADKPITEIPITNDLIKSCKLGHIWYTAVLEERKKQCKQTDKDLKRKLKGEEIAEMKEKKRALESCIQCLEKDIVDYSLAAEKESDLSLLTKANSFRVTVSSKKETLTNLESTLERLDKELKEI